MGVESQSYKNIFINRLSHISGRRRTFSVQEIIDCFHKHCERTGLEELVNWLIVNDRLAPKSKYTDYKAKEFACRAGTSPDGLTDIKVTGIRKITADNFEDEIRRNGAVLACIDTTSGGCPEYNDYRGGVIEGNSSRTVQHCTEEVLIVGFDTGYYRARASRGANWGQRGYFKIARGGNVCGIEQNLNVLETERRRSKSTVDRRTSCPVDFPKLCPKTRTCRKANQRCSSEIKTTGTSQSSSSRQKSSSSSQTRYSSGTGSGNVPAGYTFDYAAYSGRRKRDAEDCMDSPDMPCSRLTSGHCKSPRVRESCPVSCGVCDSQGTRKCQDDEKVPGECASLAEYCDRIEAVRVKCAKTCNADPIDCAASLRPVIEYDDEVKEPPRGLCYRPEIANGRALNSAQLAPGEQLRVVCNTGFTLIGEASTCEIQNVFAPDTRRLPECVRLGSEDYTRNGADYTGRLTTTIEGVECQNWLETAHTGLFDGIERGRTLLKGGNHNYCRNIGGEDLAPFCFTNGGQIKRYCFEKRKCDNDICNAEPTDVYDDCDLRFHDIDCELLDERSANRVKYVWNICAAMCCRYACRDN